MNEITTTTRNGRIRGRFGLGLTLIGLLLFLLGADPGLFNLDRSPVIGFVQIAVFLIGLAIIVVGGYISLAVFWNGRHKPIAAEMGERLVSTGYVIAVVSGMADVFGFGSQPLPDIPFFGRFQMIGVIIGEVVIALGFLLFIPWRPASEKPEADSAAAPDQLSISIDTSSH